MNHQTDLKRLENVPQPLGPRIAVARKHAGFTVSELARQLGVSTETLKRWESGQQTPRANRMLMLAGLLNVTLAWLLEGRESAFMGTDGGVTLENVSAQVESAKLKLAEVADVLDELSRRLEAMTTEGFTDERTA